MKLIYLACPFSGTPAQRKQRYVKATDVTATLMEQGYNVFSPITHSYPLDDLILPIYNTHKFWLDRDLQIISFCDELFVLALDGAETSTGVRKEIEFAFDKNIPVRIIDENLQSINLKTLLNIIEEEKEKENGKRTQQSGQGNSNF